MRWFWTFILLLALLTAGVFGLAAFRQHRAAREQLARAQAAAAQAKADALAAAVQAAQQTPSAQANTAAPVERRDAVPVPSTPTVHTPKPAAITPGTAPPASAAKPPRALPPLVPPTLAPAKIGEYDVTGAALIERTEDGLVFGEITIKGDGTQANPFVVPWDALLSAEDSFDPSMHSLRIPELVAILHDKYVRLDGYVSFPLMTSQPNELLAMLNMWDGCCIGVPPTPYDAVEVQLKKALTGDERFAVSGRVIGRFGVKPYVVKSWLVGLYVMEDAEFSPAPDDSGT